MSMLLSKTEIDQIDIKIKDIVFGFIKNIILNVPDLVCYLIVSFYYEKESFNPNLCGPDITLSNDSKIMDNRDGKGRYSTVYGKYVIPSTINATYIWKFKNIGTKIDFLRIGIDNADAKWINDASYDQKECAFYAYNC